MSVSLVFKIRMVIVSGTQLFEIRFYFWVMRKHVLVLCDEIPDFRPTGLESL